MITEFHLKNKRFFLFTIFTLAIVAAFGGGWLLGIISKDERDLSPRVNIKDDDIILGSPDAPITFVEYSDFQCPFCARFFKNSFPQLKSEYIDTGKVKFVYRDFILYGQESIFAANAARCAGEQGKFWPYHDLIFQQQRGINSGVFSSENLKKFGYELNLDQERFARCVDAIPYEKKIKESTAEAKQRLGVWGTPSFFINQSGPIFGSLDYRRFKILIDNALESFLENQ